MADATTAATTTVTLKDDVPSNFKPCFNEILDKSENLDRTKDKGFVNDKTGSSMIIREDGQINLSASICSQFKISPDGKTNEIALESITQANRKTYQIDDFVINDHKLNPDLWELSDYKQICGDSKNIIGGLTLMSTVLVKTWEPNLKRYVLIRRLARTPMFSQTLNTPTIHAALKVTDSTVVANTYDATVSKSTNSNSTTEDSGTKAMAAATTTPTATTTVTATTKVTGTTVATDVVKSATTDALASLKTVGTGVTTSVASLTKVSATNTSTIDSQVAALAAKGTTVSSKDILGSSTNMVTTEINLLSSYLSKDTTLGTAAVDTQLNQIKSDAVDKTLASMTGQTVEDKKAAMSSTLLACDNSFGQNKTSIMKAAADAQTTIESFITAQATKTKVTGTTKTTAQIKQDVYNQVLSNLKGQTTTSSILNATQLTSLNKGIAGLTTKINTNIGSSIVTNILSDITKEKASIATLTTQLKNFEQAELTSITTKLQAEAQTLVNNALASISSQISSSAANIIKGL